MRDLLDFVFGEWPQRKGVRDYLLGNAPVRWWLWWFMVAATVALAMLAVCLAIPQQ